MVSSKYYHIKEHMKNNSMCVSVKVKGIKELKLIILYCVVIQINWVELCTTKLKGIPTSTI